MKKSTAAEYLLKQGITCIELENIKSAYQILESEKVDALVYDSPVLQHYASKKGRGKVRMVGLIFEVKKYWKPVTNRNKKNKIC
ncbi:MAG: transporter substrate-binding domain-containing protein [Desulfobacteraceae bacterium]